MSIEETFVVAQCQDQVELVSGNFFNTQVGEYFGRDPMFNDSRLWKVIKIPTREQQQLLHSLSVVMGMREFQKFVRIFDIKVNGNSLL